MSVVHPPAIPSRRPRLALLAVLVGLILVTPGCFLIPRADHHGMQALEAGHPVIGAWLGAWPTDRVQVIRDFEKRIGARLDLVDVYLDWYTPIRNVTHTLQHIASRGAVPILTWEAQGLTTVDLIEGSRRLSLRDGRTLTIDQYLDEFSDGVCGVARQSDQPVLLRILHEMNGHWFAWGISHQTADGRRPNTDETYRQAWVKIHDAFDSKCGSLARFIWAVNHFSVGEGASFTGTYPGDAYVDFVGIDGYNWGGHAEWGWQSFEVLFKEAYCEVSAASPRPILIAETASTEKGGNKAAWIMDVFNQMERYSRIRGIVWFNDAKHEIEIRGEMDWPVDSSPAALNAFSQGVQLVQGIRERGSDSVRPSVPSMLC